MSLPLVYKIKNYLKKINLDNFMNVHIMKISSQKINTKEINLLTNPILFSWCSKSVFVLFPISKKIQFTINPLHYDCVPTGTHVAADFNCIAIRLCFWLD